MIGRAGLLSLLLLAVALTPGAGRTEQPVGFVAAQRGAVDLERAGRKTRIRLGHELRAGDLVVTETDSRVRISLNDGATLSLGAGGRLRLAELAFDPQAKVFDGELGLSSGLLRAVLGQGPRSLLIRTPSAVVALEAGDVLVTAGEDSTSVYVIAGAAQVGDGHDVAQGLTPGFGSEVARGAPPSAPAPWGRARLERAIASSSLP